MLTMKTAHSKGTSTPLHIQATACLNSFFSSFLGGTLNINETRKLVLQHLFENTPPMTNPIRSKSRGTVNSFLNEKIRTAPDLDNLDVLLQNFQNQQELQKQQVGTFDPARKRDRLLTRCPD